MNKVKRRTFQAEVRNECVWQGMDLLAEGTTIYAFYSQETSCYFEFLMDGLIQIACAQRVIPRRRKLMVDVTVSGTQIRGESCLESCHNALYAPRYQTSSLSISNGTYIFQSRHGRYPPDHRHFWLEVRSCGLLCPVFNLRRFGGTRAQRPLWECRRRFVQHSREENGVRTSPTLSCSGRRW